MRRLRGLTAVLVTTMLAACGGGGTGGSAVLAAGHRPADLAYAEIELVYGHEVDIPPLTPAWSGGEPSAFSVEPELPPGFHLDPATGVLSGRSTRRLTPPTVYRITATNDAGHASTELSITVGVLEFLAPGYSAELVLDGLATPARMAPSPDGRIFFNELRTGDTRVVRADGTLQPEPFAHTDVVVGGHRGLLGIALHPDFAQNAWVYVLACAAGSGETSDRIQVKRYTAVDAAGIWVGTNETVIVDDLPLAAINNGGTLVFGTEAPSPRLYVSVGDSEDEANAQVVGGKAGRVLRFTDTGSVPEDNPTASDPTWCLGLRNTFAMAVHPESGDLWGGDNGPASNDELNYLRAGRNFEWGHAGPPLGPLEKGVIVTRWVDAIVPTGLAWHDGTGWGDQFENDLFLASYTEEAIWRFELSGLGLLDIDLVSTVAAFRPSAVDNKPLDVKLAPGGNLLVSTFTGIYRIRR